MRRTLLAGRLRRKLRLLQILQLSAELQPALFVFRCQDYTTSMDNNTAHEKLDIIACCLVLSPANELLLLQRHSDKPGGRMWAVPGGRTEPTEKLLQTAKRELWEETGIHAELTLLGTHEVVIPHSTVHMTTFLAKQSYKPDIKINQLEHHAYRWVPLEEILKIPQLVWGTPTVLYDFKLLQQMPSPDPTLSDGSTIRMVPTQPDANNTPQK
jgi:8-oxo-dGTP pyrophosphatase MutT (NUDIX family)